MLLLQRPNSAMDQDFASHGMNPGSYDHDRQRRGWNDQVPYNPPYATESNTQLPPIQTQRSAYEQTPTTYDPVRRPAPLPTTLGPSYSPYTTQSPQSPYGHAMPQYQQNNTHIFTQSQPQMSPISHQYPNSTYSPIRPMPALAPGQGHNMTGYPPNHNYQFPPQNAEEVDTQPRLHVVGSQGRRGVLPSDEGKPPAISNGANGTKTTIIPQKDADGKFPCPHCQKTYLHGKHLKRHLLRHTGDRPYSCFLCNDTFSRSDILKRHFQKCSQRRGNPTGASHLAFSTNHLKRQAAKAKQQQQQQAAQAAASGVPAAADPNLPPVSQAAMNNTAPIYADTTNPYDARDPRSAGAMPSPGFNRSNHSFLAGQAGPSSHPSSGSSTPLTAKTPGQFPQTYQTDRPYPDVSQRGHLSQLSSGSQFDNNTFEWHSYHGKDSSGSVIPSTAVLPMAASSDSQNTFPDNQQEPTRIHNNKRGLHDGESMGSGLRLNIVSQAKADRLISFCQLDTSEIPIHDRLRTSLTPTNIEHFISQYQANFYQHFPIIHIPTFDPEMTHDGLLLSIICTGAVYSDRLEIQETRELAELTVRSLEKSPPWLDGSSAEIDLDDNDLVDTIVDELHAYASTLSLKMWHDTDSRKEQAMQEWSICTSLAFRLRLNEPITPSNHKFSLFHQPEFVENRSIHDFDYETWLWQEKRNRLMYIIFLSDAVQAFFFNQAPSLDPFQLRIPLPCDDSVWDATTPEECCRVLGFYGSEHQEWNTSGSLRKKQPEMHLAMAVLETPGLELSSRCTNAASKFLLIHGLLDHLWNAQKTSFLPATSFDLDNLDWVVQSKSSAANFSATSHLDVIELATDKWIRAWDHDMTIQYPPGVERVGYSRDGVHYYWLAKLLLQNSDTVNVHSSWNERFQQILKILKNVKQWVLDNQLKRGEQTGAGSLVDERYGLEDLSKDLKLLLAPL